MAAADIFLTASARMYKQLLASDTDHRQPFHNLLSYIMFFTFLKLWW